MGALELDTKALGGGGGGTELMDGQKCLISSKKIYFTKLFTSRFSKENKRKPPCLYYVNAFWPLLNFYPIRSEVPNRCEICLTENNGKGFQVSVLTKIFM